MVSLFADMTYEGARSIAGPYLAILGASGTVVGLVSGFGEFIGYALRLLSGYISDRTRSYWAITFTGYFINLLAVPLLALANQWMIAALLLVVERLGRAIRTPARDAMLSYATHTTGRGWGFGLHEAMDQVGAMIGPLLVAVILYLRYDYSLGFAILLIPALIALTLLICAYYFYPHPEDLETSSQVVENKGLNHSYWLFVIASCCIAAGFVDFPLIAYHFERVNIAPALWIPIMYSVAMGVDGVTALLLGKWFDREGMIVLIIAIFFSALLAPCVFLGNVVLAWLGIVLWGIGMGVQESLIRAVIAHLVSVHQRATAFGMFHLCFGVFWLMGSALMGYLYDHFLIILVLFSVVFQLASLPFLWILKKRQIF